MRNPTFPVFTVSLKYEMTLNAQFIQSLINLGEGIAAPFLGLSMQHYRPLSTGPVIASANLLETIYIAFDQDPGFNYRKPHMYGVQQYFAVMDATNAKIGDYYSDGGANTYYVNQFELIHPVAMMRCNRTVTIQQPAGSSSNGYQYGGNTSPQTLLTNWPASVVSGVGKDKNESNTPGSVYGHGVTVFVPYYTPIPTFSIVIDDLGRRYIVNENEQSELGYRLECSAEIV